MTQVHAKIIMITCMKSLLYKVEYPDGTTDQLADNIIAENMMSQVDSEGHHYQVLTEVTDQKKDHVAIAKVGGLSIQVVGTYTGRGRLVDGNS